MKPIDETDLIAHLESPHHRGRLADPTCSHFERNSACGDWVRLELRLDRDDRIEAAYAYFESGGCIISQAAASLLCEYIEGRTLSELASFQARDMLALIDIPLTPRRQQCGLLAFRALKTIVLGVTQSTDMRSQTAGGWREIRHLSCLDARSNRPAPRTIAH